jgi:hypothetical protein
VTGGATAGVAAFSAGTGADGLPGADGAAAGTDETTGAAGGAGFATGVAGGFGIGGAVGLVGAGATASFCCVIALRTSPGLEM